MTKVFSQEALSTPESILDALTLAIKEGYNSISIPSPGHNSVRLIEVPDTNEVVVLREIYEEYNRLKDAGNRLTLNGDEENVSAFAGQLLELISSVEPKDAPNKAKNREDVIYQFGREFGLIELVSEVWDEIKEDSSDENAPFFNLVDYKEEEMRVAYRNAVLNHFIDGETSESDFLYYFGRSSTQPTGEIKWTSSVVELTAFLTAITADAHLWKKAAEVFLVLDKNGGYKSVDHKVLKQSACRDGERDYNKARERRLAILEKLFPKNDDNPQGE